MPLYEYRCTVCRHAFEVHHDVGGTPGPCPVCGGTVRRIFTSVGLIFKGSGFYTTDSRKAAPSQAKESSGESGKDGRGTTEGGTKETGAKETGAKATGTSTEAASKGT
jgi:putative FmdB family regulatory protein